MSLETILKKHDIDLTPKKVEAFLLGVLHADKPLSLKDSIKELFVEGLDLETHQQEIENEINQIWTQLSKNPKKSMEVFFQHIKSHSKEDILLIGNLIDYFLMGLTLSGTSYDTVEDEVIAELLEDLEDWVIDVDEWVAEGEDTESLDDWKEDGIVLKEEFHETWDKLTKAYA